MSSFAANIKDKINTLILSPLNSLPKSQKYVIIGGVSIVSITVSIWGLFEIQKNSKSSYKYQNTETSIPEYQAKLVVKCGNCLGETPIWDDKRKLLCWIDAIKPSFWTYNPSTKESKSYPLPERVGSFCLTKDDGFLMAFAKGPAFYNPLTNNGRPVDDKERIFLFEPNLSLNIFSVQQFSTK